MDDVAAPALAGRRGEHGHAPARGTNVRHAPGAGDLAFDPQPTLAGALVALRPLCADDHDALYAAAGDPLVWAQHPEPDRHRPEVFARFFLEALASGGALVATDNVGGRVIGTSRYHGFDPARREVEIGWTFLARSHWGGRYNAEVKCLMLRHAFGSVGRVLFFIGPENVRSQRAVERIGGVRVEDPHAQSGGDRAPRVAYAITAAAFARGPLARGPLAADSRGAGRSAGDA